MQGILKNSGVSDRESMIEQMKKMSQPNPQQQQMQMQAGQLDMALKQAEVQKTQAEAQKTTVEAQIAPDVAKARIIAAISNNLNEENEGQDFTQRMEIANLMLKNKDIESNERIARMQVDAKRKEKQQDSDYITAASQAIQ